MRNNPHWFQLVAFAPEQIEVQIPLTRYATDVMEIAMALRAQGL